MVTSIVKLLPEYHAAAIRPLPFACCNARTSEVLEFPVKGDCPLNLRCAKPGRAVPSPASGYPPAPYTPLRVPWVVESGWRNLLGAGPPPGVTPPLPGSKK